MDILRKNRKNIYEKRVRKKTSLLITTALLLILLFVLSACTGVPRRRDTPLTSFEENRYYQGFDGVLMAFVPNMPPYRMYYYGDQYENYFDVTVETANIGSSWARGGIYLSGYDPTMIEFEGINPGRTSARACIIDIGNIGFGEFGGTLRCEDFFVGVGSEGTIDVFFNNLFGRSGPYADLYDFDRLGGIDFGYRSSAAGNERISINFNDPNIDIEYANHGVLMIGLFQGINFENGFGQEYILAGDTYEYPGGDLAHVSFRGNIVNWPPGLDQTDQTFMITNCFLYATYAAPIVCIDPTPFSEDRKVCYPTPYTGTKGQGAPVAVTYIEQENSPRQAVFTIHVKNVGRGQVYDPGKLEMCSPYFPGRVSNADLNIAYIGDIRVSGDLQRLDCTPNNFVRLDPHTGEGIITCTYNIPFSGLRSAYRTPLVVELWYGYSRTLQKRVFIKRAI
ncbi:hypothetical protein KY348_01930 [Candidatus Woesearchaeota archaeon]|nr:hypothetical protein [Candidatus Woesearchaeota archaeon]